MFPGLVAPTLNLKCPVIHYQQVYVMKGASRAGRRDDATSTPNLSLARFPNSLQWQCVGSICPGTKTVTFLWIKLQMQKRPIMAILSKLCGTVRCHRFTLKAHIVVTYLTWRCHLGAFPLLRCPHSCEEVIHFRTCIQINYFENVFFLHKVLQYYPIFIYVT